MRASSEPKTFQPTLKPFASSSASLYFDAVGEEQQEVVDIGENVDGTEADEEQEDEEDKDEEDEDDEGHEGDEGDEGHEDDEDDEDDEDEEDEDDEGDEGNLFSDDDTSDDLKNEEKDPTFVLEKVRVSPRTTKGKWPAFYSPGKLNKICFNFPLHLQIS